MNTKQQADDRLIDQQAANVSFSVTREEWKRKLNQIAQEHGNAWAKDVAALAKKMWETRNHIIKRDNQTKQSKGKRKKCKNQNHQHSTSVI